LWACLPKIAVQAAARVWEAARVPIGVALTAIAIPTQSAWGLPTLDVQDQLG